MLWFTRVVFHSFSPVVGVTSDLTSCTVVANATKPVLCRCAVKKLLCYWLRLKNMTYVCLLCVVKTLCETERDKPVALGASGVDCEPDGSFKPLQCNAGHSRCWCVDGLGHEVPKTRTSVYVDYHKPNCGTYLQRDKMDRQTVLWV